MNEMDFCAAVKDAIAYNQLERYFTLNGEPLAEGGAAVAGDHYALEPIEEKIAADLASPGGLKLSHAQRRMLIFLVALWDGRAADRLFPDDGLGALATAVMAMDKQNRALLGELLYTFPGWAG